MAAALAAKSISTKTATIPKLESIHITTPMTPAERACVKGKTRNRAAEDGSHKEAKEHQRASRKADNRFGDHIVGLSRPDGKDIFGAAAHEIVRDEHAHKHRDKEVQAY